MDFALSEDHELRRDAAREFLSKRCPVDSVPAMADTEPGWRPALWPQLAAMGWLDADLGILDHVILLEESAAQLVPAPLFSALALTWPVVTADPMMGHMLSVGDIKPTLAWAEEGSTSLIAGATGGTTTFDDGVVTGVKHLVPDAAWADCYIVVTNGPDGTQMVRVGADDSTVTTQSTSDRTRRLGVVQFTNAPAHQLLTLEPADGVLRQIQRRAFVLAAAEALGVARAALDLGVAHARERVQFGKSIGTYQAVSHRLVDAYQQTELARSLTYWAAHAIDAGEPLVDAACAAAKAAAARAAIVACENAIQVCGAIGITWEHVLHRYYKRAQWLQCFVAGHNELHADIAEAVLGPPA